MFYSNSLNLKQISGGNQIKQGDFGSRFSYKLANEKNQELDDFDEEVAHINLVLNDKIVFTTTATVDNSTVTFNIDKAIPVGLYFLEIKIRDYIFPSDKQTIIFVQSGSVAYDLKELVPNYDTNMEIAGILSDLSQKGIDISDLKTKMNAIYNNALSDHAEIAEARYTFDTLNSRLNNIDETKKSKNKKEIDFIDYGFIPNDSSAEAHNNALFAKLMLETESLSLNVPAGNRFWIGNVTISRGEFDLYGGGTITGNLICDEGYSKNHIFISDITFKFDSMSDDNNPIILSELTRSAIKNCYFMNCNKAISYKSIDHAQHVSRISIDNNYMQNVNYALYGERQAGGKQPLISADIHFTNNIVEECYITHVHVEGFDGGVISNNTFFFPSYMRRPTNKKYNIYIDYCDWTVISNNNLFEAGLDSIHVEHGKHLNITGNNIAWCGQRLGGSGIKLINLDNAGGRFNISTISNNIIMYPTESGVYLNNVGHIAVDGNNIFGAGNTTYFYGDTSVLGGLEKWGIYLGATSERIAATDNLCTQNAINNLNTAKNIIKNNMTADNSGTTIDVSKSEFTVTIASGTRVGTAGTNIPANKILSATLIYSDDVFNNVATPCINPDGSLSVVTSSATSANRSYKVRVSLLN